MTTEARGTWILKRKFQRVAVVFNQDYEVSASADSSARCPWLEANASIAGTAEVVQGILASAGVEATCIPVSGHPDGLVATLIERKFDAVFNLVESLDGDASREYELPALLETAGIPYTGNAPSALRLCFMKDRAKLLLAAHGYPVPRGLAAWRPEEITDSRLSRLGLPLFVKPGRSDASIGIDQNSVFPSRRGLRKRCDWLMANVSPPVLIEQYLPGPEYNVAILPDPFSGLLIATRIDFSGCPEGLLPVVTYSSKWLSASPEYAAVSRPFSEETPESLRKSILRIARGAFLSLGGTSYGRVDLRLDEAGRPVVIDVNPNPDLAAEAGIAVAAASTGLAYRDFILTLAAGASLKESHVSSPVASLRPRTFSCLTAAY